jgi:hypothetical protein
MVPNACFIVRTTPASSKVGIQFGQGTSATQLKWFMSCPPHGISNPKGTWAMSSWYYSRSITQTHVFHTERIPKPQLSAKHIYTTRTPLYLTLPSSNCLKAFSIPSTLIGKVWTIGVMLWKAENCRIWLWTCLGEINTPWIRSPETMSDRDGTDKFAPETARGGGTAWSDHGEVPAMQLN